MKLARSRDVVGPDSGDGGRRRKGRLGLLLGAALAVTVLGALAAPSAFANVAPVCTDTEYTVASGDFLNLQGQCTDSDGPSPLSYSLVSSPLHGTLSGTPSGSATYQPYYGFEGDDSFQYRASDGADNSNTATVTIHVTALSGNQPPECPDSLAYVPTDGSVVLSGNCTDADPGDSIFYSLQPPSPTHGTLQILSGSSVLYTPVPGTPAGTTDSFGYSATDNHHSPVPVTVEIRVVDPGVNLFSSATEATPTEPVVASVTTTQSGGVNIDERQVTSSPPTGYFLLNQEFDITAPPATDASHPLQLAFTIDASQVPAGPVTVFRDGTAVALCNGGPGVASPDPCVASSLVDSTTGDLRITVLSTHASLWNFGVSAGYDFHGFFQPVDNLPTLNVVKAGSSIPVKFNLGGNQGLDVLAEGSPASKETACDASAGSDAVEQTVTANRSSLTYDAIADQYIYAWKTEKSWAGTCRQLQLKFNDGTTTHAANFKLAK